MATVVNAYTKVALFKVRAFLFPLALLSLVVLGLHAGSDRLDDLAFRILNGIDRVIDYALAAVLQAVLPRLGMGEVTVSRWVFAAVSIIDLDDKRWAARALALVFELISAALMVWPVLRHRNDRTDWASAFPRPTAITNVGTVFAPVTIAFSSLVGALVVAGQSQLQLFWMLRSFGHVWAGRLAGAGALVVLAVVLWRVALPAIQAGLAFGRAQMDRPPWHRGIWLVGPLFISALAMAPAPLWRALKGLGPW